MPLVRWFRRMPLLVQLATALSVAMVLIIGLAVAVVALATADRADRAGRATARCVNYILGEHNGPQARDAAAHVAYAQADKKFSDALTDVVTAPQGSQAQRDAYDRFVAAAKQKKAADAAYVHVLVADQKARAAKPFGRC